MSVAGPREFIDAVERWATVTCTTALPPPATAATLAALRLLQTEPQHFTRLRANGDRLAQIFDGLGHGVPSLPCPVIGFTCDDEARSRLEQAMSRSGIAMPFIRYPDGPQEGYYRITVTAAHTDDDMDRLLRCMTEASTGGGITALGSLEPDPDADP